MLKNSPLCVNIQFKQREYFIKAIYLNIKETILKNWALPAKVINCRLYMVTYVKRAVTSSQVANTAVHPHTTQTVCRGFALRPLRSQNGNGATAASCHFVRAMEQHLIMRGCSSPWRCDAWVTVKVLYSDKSLVVEFMIKAESVSLHTSTHARTKTVRI